MTTCRRWRPATLHWGLSLVVWWAGVVLVYYLARTSDQHVAVKDSDSPPVFVDGNSSNSNISPGDLKSRHPPKQSERLVEESELAERARHPVGPQTHVLLAAYQKTGSTLVGSLFNAAQLAFYLYEPLDLLYAAMYGVRGGWTVPNDVLFLPNGSHRVMPRVEALGVRWLLDRLYTCHLSALPPAALAHPFWEQFGQHMHYGRAYSRCINTRSPQLVPRMKECQRHLANTCGIRFGAVSRNMDVCRHRLWGSEADMVNWKQFVPNSAKYKTDPHRNESDVFVTYLECVSQEKDILVSCAEFHLDAACRRSSVVAAKVVRPAIHAVRSLFETDPHFYLVHLVRDPRGTLRARFFRKFTRSLYWRGFVLSNEARMYCTTVEHNLTMLKQLVDFQSRILQVIFDEFAQDAPRQGARVYRFLGRKLPPEVRAQLQDMHTGSRRAPHGRLVTEVVQSWRNVHQDDLDVIVSACKQLYGSILSNAWSDLNT